MDRLVPVLIPVPELLLIHSKRNRCNGFCLLKYKVDRIICLIGSKEPFRRSRGHFIFVMVCFMLCSALVYVNSYYLPTNSINGKRFCKRARSKGTATSQTHFSYATMNSFTYRMLEIERNFVE